LKNRELIELAAFLVAAVFLVIGIIVLINNFNPGKRGEVISVGAVYSGAIDDNGWNQSHYEGIKKACEANSCKLFSKMEIPYDEDIFVEVISDLAGKGCSCIFLTSYGYGAYLSRVAKQYPNIAFYSVSGEGDANTPNCTTYYVRMYQARYLAGIVAGASSKSGILGYITASPSPETIRTINAYALGAQLVNPSAKVFVVYTGNWNDREAEEEAVRALSKKGADSFTYFEDRPYSIDLADEMGLFSTGYDRVTGEHSERFLTAALDNWDILYTEVLGDYLSGRANFDMDYWIGLSEGAVSLYPYSDMVSEETKELVESETERIKTSRDVFSGEIYDNNGVLRCGENERISDDELFNHLDWYVEGVEVYE
jgi:basic membrane protein A